ncbi:hypothetical protein GCM10018980_58560 [Streptomyces capoamus]|uniref:Uncharacterized protein n=1 Tax=Streptomyces capoamus TaxID=68183 RepID=A0A919F165_9ACTN|nr:hypothetical protein GCM10010501_48260 [Streptomyces libani subsp. rufus]GHG66274.1 hypothetical protein GCM10018980_58560 [Streptomyces capoamus]
MAVTRDHIGKTVTDGQRSGVLTDIMKEWEDPAEKPGERVKRTVAFVRPSGGGREWLARPSRLAPL